ncbi:MAG: Holliday junction resolvase RuvX [Candidatus Babeliales bacterium]
MKILALDIGDRWTGTALSDALGMFAQPYKTIETTALNEFIKETITQEQIKTIIIGYPRTLRGTESEQTKKTKIIAAELNQSFPSIEWTFWDERLTSKQAEKLKKTKTKEEKRISHSIAAAFILTGYLEHLYFQKNQYNKH